MSLLLKVITENEEQMIQNIGGLLASLKFEIRDTFVPPDAALFMRIAEEELHAFKAFLATKDSLSAGEMGKAAFNKGHTIHLVDSFFEHLSSQVLACIPGQTVEFSNDLHTTLFFYYKVYIHAYYGEQARQQNMEQELMNSSLHKFIIKQQKEVAHVIQKQKYRTYNITGAEKKVITLALSGKSNESIARALAVTIDTVKCHLKHVFKKTGVRNRVELSLLFKAADLE